MTSYEIVVTIVQFAVRVVVGVTLAVFWRQLSIVQSDFRARMRPYLGFTEITREETGEVDKLEFKALVKNFGSLPAKDAKVYGEFIVTGEEPGPFEAATRGSVFPSYEAIWRFGAIEIDKDAILSGLKIIKLRLDVEYYGSGGERYQTSTERIYDPQRDDWTNEEGSWV